MDTITDEDAIINNIIICPNCMKLRNDFSDETRTLWTFCYECWVCGKNHWDAGHHIVGRGLGDSDLESSPLNFAPVSNFECHLDEAFNDEDKRRMLQKTIRWLLKNDYQLTKKDVAFYEKYKTYYK